MSELRGLVACTHLADVARSIALYERLGLREDNRFAEGGVLVPVGEPDAYVPFVARV